MSRLRFCGRMSLRTKPRAAFVHARAAVRHVRLPRSRRSATSARLRSGRADVAIFHEHVPPPSGGGHQFLRALAGELERRGLDGRGEPHLRRHACLPLQLVQLRPRSACGGSRATTCGWCIASTGRSASTAASTTAPTGGSPRSNAELAHATVVPVALQPRGAPELGHRARRPGRDPERARPGDLLPARGARAARRPPCPRRRGELVGQPAQGGRRARARSTRQLDPGRYELTFVGRSPTGLDGLDVVGPLASEALAELLAAQDCVRARRASTTRARTRSSKRSPAGFPALYRRSGGHPELVGEAGVGVRGPGRRRRPRSSRLAAELDARRARDRRARHCRRRRPVPRGAPRDERRPASRARPRRLARRGAVRLRTRGWAPLGRASSSLGRRARLGARRRGRVRDAASPARRLPARARRRGPRCAAPPGGLPHEPLRRRSTRGGRARRTGSGSRTSTGGPGRPGYPEFDRAYETLARDPGRFARVQVTHARDGGARPRGGRRADRASTASRSGSSSTPSRSATPRGARAARRGARASRATRSSSARSRRTGSGSATGSSRRSIKGPDVLVEALELVRARDRRPRRPAHRPRPRVRAARARAPRRSRTCTGAARRGTGSPRAYHALDAYVVASRQEGGPEERARVDGDGDPARHDPCRPGAGPRRRRRERHPRRRRGRRRRSPRPRARPRRRRARRRARERRATDRGGERPRALAPRWEALLDGFAERVDG